MSTRIPKERASGIRLQTEGREDVRRIAESVLAASLGFDIAARRATSKSVAKRMTSLAEEARAIAATAAASVPGGVRRPTMSERMRWEWLASTAAMIDHGAEGRLAEEAYRLLEVARDHALSVDEDDLLARIERLAASSRRLAA